MYTEKKPFECPVNLLVLIQGNRGVIIDWKTDRKSSEISKEEFLDILKERYSNQVSFYKRFLLKMENIHSCKAYIYSTFLGKLIEV